MAVFDGVFDVTLGNNPSRVARRRKVGLDGTEPFRKSAEVSGFGAQDVALVLVKQSSHFSRVSDRVVGVRVEHGREGVSGSRKE